MWKKFGNRVRRWQRASDIEGRGLLAQQADADIIGCSRSHVHNGHSVRVSDMVRFCGHVAGCNCGRLRVIVGCSRRRPQLQLATCPQNLTISLTLTLCAIVDVAPAAANTICVGLLSQYASPFDVAGSLPTPDSISEFLHILGRYFHETQGSLNFITVTKTL